MGKTIPPFRPALEGEIQSWTDYRRGLVQIPLAAKAFDELMIKARSQASAGALACRIMLSETLFMNILVELQMEIDELKSKKADK